jgi:hypothetical protein
MLCSSSICLPSTPQAPQFRFFLAQSSPPTLSRRLPVVLLCSSAWPPPAADTIADPAPRPGPWKYCLTHLSRRAAIDRGAVTDPQGVSPWPLILYNECRCHTTWHMALRRCIIDSARESCFCRQFRMLPRPLRVTARRPRPLAGPSPPSAPPSTQGPDFQYPSHSRDLDFEIGLSR